MIRFGVVRIARAFFFATLFLGRGAHAQPDTVASERQEPPRVEVANPAASRGSWLLQGGQPVHAQLQAWAAEAQWQLVWRPRVSWLVTADTRFEGSFTEAIEKVTLGLFHEGKPVRLVLWEGNRVAEVLSNDIR